MSRGPIKAWRNHWYQVQLYRNPDPYDHFGRPLKWIIEKIIWQHRITLMYCTTKELRTQWRNAVQEQQNISKDIERHRKEMDILEDKEEPKKPGFQPVVITGGRGPDDPNWLSNLKVGTCFLARDKYIVNQQGQKVINSIQVDLERFTLNLNFDRSSWLTLHLVDRDVTVFVDTLRFSLSKEQIEIIESI